MQETAARTFRRARTLARREEISRWISSSQQTRMVTAEKASTSSPAGSGDHGQPKYQSAQNNTQLAKYLFHFTYLRRINNKWLCYGCIIVAFLRKVKIKLRKK